VPHPIAAGNRLPWRATQAGAEEAPPEEMMCRDWHMGQVVPIATATNTAGEPIEVGRGPGLIAVTPDGKTAYVINFYSHSVTPIATATKRRVRRSRSATGHMRSRSRPEPAIFDLPPCGVGRRAPGGPKAEPGAGAGPAAPQAPRLSRCGPIRLCDGRSNGRSERPVGSCPQVAAVLVTTLGYRHGLLRAVRVERFVERRAR
jgi:hypothetical protein